MGFKMKKRITYDQVKKYHKKAYADIRHLLSLLEEKVIEARDNPDPEKRVPIYLTKWRVKGLDSLYLKTKRKNYESLDKITDLGGFRILCLFEQDLISVNEFLVDLLSSGLIDGMKEAKLYYWNDEIKDKLKGIINKNFEDVHIEEIDPRINFSGYKSIHYVVEMSFSKARYTVEIQVRTLLQDVWGELEHALVYKRGNSHPHIQKSFYLLSRDLETVDSLVTHLRDIRDKEKCIELFAIKNIGPYKVLGYEDHLLPNIFKENGRLREKFEKYEEHAASDRNEGALDDWIAKCVSLFEAITSNLERNESEDFKVRYWREAEEAFLEFVKGDLPGALSKYQEIVSLIEKQGRKYYVPYFRIGEIYFIQGHIEMALVEFDKSEEILSGYENYNPVNAYRIKVKLANTYWQLGSEYLNLALDEILEAEKIYEKWSDLFNEKDYYLLVNNLCWYCLEKYIQTKNQKGEAEAEEDYRIAEGRFKVLEKGLGDSHNAYDTAMWFCYQSYLKTKDRSLLEQAKKYCQEGKNKKIYATNTMASINVYRSHVQEIMSSE